MSKPKITKLSSGLTVITEENKDMHSVLVSVGVKAGGRDEQNSQVGIAHLLEHMAFKGTKTRNYEQLINDIEDQGGHTNAYTGKTETVYYIKILKEKAELAVDVLSDIIQNSVFPAEELEKERHVVIQEIKRAEDSPSNVAYRKFYSSCFPNHPLGRSILGTEEQILSYKRKDLIKFVQQHYVPNNMVVSFSGNIDNATAIKLVKKYFKEPKAEYTHKRKQAKFTPGHTLLNKDGLNQVQVILGFKTCDNKDQKKAMISHLLSSILGSGMSSRLYMEIREKRGLVYSVYSFSDSNEDVGIFAIMAGTDDEKLEELLTATFDLINNVENTVTKEELETTKVRVLSSLLMSSEDTDTANRNLSEYFDHGKIQDMATLKKIVNSVTLKDIQNMAKEIFSTKPNITILGNEKVKSIPLKN